LNIPFAARVVSDAWTAKELESMGRAAGFARSQIQALPPSPQTMVVFS